ncbi:hypothetical protein MC885_021739 [Smutsia gigantea]|nr:hypothetical protein MC885_021739 [Smutsia gigantea]
MSIGPSPPPCSKASNSRNPSPVPEIYGPEDHATLQMSTAETPHVETAVSPPFTADLLVQHSPDSSTRPRVKLLPAPVEEHRKQGGESPGQETEDQNYVLSDIAMCTQ